MAIQKKVIGSFVATNQAGQSRVVYIVSEIEAGGPAADAADGTAEGVEVGRHYVTAEGYRVDREAKGLYREIFTKEIITSGDPDAP
jgi:hypothetical protein